MTRHNIFRTVAASVVLILATSIQAVPITESQAHAVASRFMVGKMLQPVQLHHGLPAPHQCPYYVFNAEASQGYVVVSGNDLTPAILGYSNTGTFDANDVPPAMQQLLDYYAESMTNMPSHPAKLIARDAIAPLTTSIWGQGEPFNHHLQFMDTTAYGDTIVWQAQVGSAAIAMAQLMYYHKWPQATEPIPGYTTQTQGLVMPELPDTTFEWDLMKDVYHTTDSANANGLAVALLCQYCAHALETDFLQNSSIAATNTLPNKLIQYFDYAATARFVKRESYSTQEWEDMLYTELMAARPVIYRGENNAGLHTFIVDGCDSSGLYHVNWGWNGMSDGYFVLSDLNPTTQGTGGYINKQAMVIGAKPDDGSLDESHIRFHSMTVRNTSGTPVDSIGNFKVNVTGVYHNNTNQEETFDYGWGIFLGDEMLSTLATKSRATPLAPNYQITSTFDLEFGAELSENTYFLRPIWSELDEEDWKVCEGGMYNFIEVTISEDTCIYQLHGPSGTPEYVVNDLTFTGTLHAGKQVTATASITNLGYTIGDMIHILDNGTKAYTTMVDLDKDCTGDVKFYFTPDTAGTHIITLSLLENGTDTLFVQELVIDSMPAATLTMESQILNVTDTLNLIITSRIYSIEATITNVDTLAYDEDIVLRLFRIQDGENGIAVQDV
ncbi:MAG: C10 family peptidase, partial [Muribaculaceae bacterium]|nr:C10 family peptidase [Muribaculaceae bacterium]